MNVICIIPARYASTRLPGKPLFDIAGKSMIQHVVERVRQAKRPARILVATDDERIFDVVQGFGGEACMTSADHLTGTDRLAEVATMFPEADLVLNVQGDEPLIPPQALDELVAAFDGQPDLQMATLMTPMAESDYENPAAVKVVVSLDGHALYFSRSLIPYPRNRGPQWRCFKHVGVYAYRRDFLLRFAALPPSPLELAESLEQLRALEYGYCIRVIETPFASIGVDTLEDLARVRHMFQTQQEESL
jgi:3-deoxy-manno-octulosonate cytidylyltransferase (CMP-KDO synthetase)